MSISTNLTKLVMNENIHANQNVHAKKRFIQKSQIDERRNALILLQNRIGITYPKV